MVKIVIINGYQIMYIKNIKNLTSVHVYVKVGSIYETKKNSGIAHLIEHMILDSWKKCNGSCSTHWSKKGIISNGQTASAYTRYFMLGSNNGDQKYVYEYMSSIISDPKFTQKLLQTSKEAVKEELTNQLNLSSWKLNNTLYNNITDSTIYKGYSHMMDYPVKIYNLDKINMKDVTEYYNAWYNPENVFISVCTNEPIEKVSNYLSKYLKVYKSPVPPKYITGSINITPLKRYTLIHRPNIQKTSYIIGYVHNNPDKDVFIYKDLIKDLLVGDISSVLLLSLRIKFNLVYMIGMSYECNKGFMLTTFRISCDFKNSEILLKEFLKSMSAFKKGAFDKKMLDRSLTRMDIINTNNDKNNTEFLNNFYCSQYFLTNSTTNTPANCADKIKKATKQKIIQIANDMFNDNNVFVVVEK